VTEKVELLVGWASQAILVLSSMVVVALFVLRRRGGAEPAYRCTGYPVTPVVYLTVSLSIAAAGAIAHPLSTLYGALIVGAGFPLYALIRKGTFS
jgi:APA family basic amino acid/polyamine antiporter